jgi:phage major head subunit gpT-like protein
MIINNANLDAAFAGFRTQYLDAYQGSEPTWPKFAMRSPSNAASETYAWLGAIPGMKKLAGEVATKKLAGHGYTITNDEYADAVEVSEKDIKTDRIGIYNPMFQALGTAAKQHPDELFAHLLVDGFTNLGYTGGAFFSANQEPVVGGTKFSNAGTKKLSATNFKTARTSIRGRRNAEGRAMKLGKQLLLIVCPDDEDLADELLVAERTSAGATNVLRGKADILVLPELTTYAAEGALPWFVMDVGQPVKPFIFQVVEEPSDLLRQDRSNGQVSDAVFDLHVFRYQAYGIYAAGYGLPELAYGSTGADAA